jgi:hypothetical protein
MLPQNKTAAFDGMTACPKIKKPPEQGKSPVSAVFLFSFPVV